MLWVLDDALARLEDLDLWHVALHLIQQERGDVGLEHGGSDGEDVDTDEEGDLGSSVVDQGLGTTGNDEDVANTADDDTPEDHGETTEFGIGKVSNDERQAVGDEREGLGGGIGDLLAEAQSTLGGLGSSSDSTVAVTARWERSVDVVGPNQGTT